MASRPSRAGKPCRYQSAPATLRTPSSQQQQQSKIVSVVGTHGSSARNHRAGRVGAAAPTSPPRPVEPEWEHEQPPAPLVDDNLVGHWEQDVPVPPPSVTFADDIEDVYHSNSRGHTWVAWSSEAFASNILWQAERWKVHPAGMPPMFDLSDIRQLGVPNADEQSTFQPPPTVSVAAEEDPRRYRFHSQLYSAAMQGDVKEVQQVLQLMSESNLPPGPAALHTLVFAHVKAGDAEAALQSARDVVNIGMPLLEETYIALVYGLVEEGKVELAEGVIMSMYNAGGTTRHGWLALTKGLFRKGGNVTVAFQHLQKGLQEGWNPDASLFEHVIQAFCVADNKEQAERVLTSMPDLGCPPHTVHINLLVELVARLQGVESALQYIKTTFDALEDRQDVDRLGQDPVPKALPNNDTFCAVFRGVMCDTAHRKVEPGTSVETYGDVTSAMMKADVTVGPRIMSYGLDLYLMDGEALEQISSLRRIAGEGWTEHVNDEQMVELLAALGDTDRPLDLAVLLRELERRSRHLRLEVLPTHGVESSTVSHPLSALTSWLQLRLQGVDSAVVASHPSEDVGGTGKVGGAFSSKTRRILAQADIANFNGKIDTVDVALKPESVDKQGNVTPAECEQLAVGIAKCVVTEDGQPMKINSMRKVHLLGELQARGFVVDPRTRAADLKAEVKLHRDVLEAHIEKHYNKQQLEGGWAMTHVQSLIAAGSSIQSAMAQVKDQFNAQAVEGMSMAAPQATEEAESMWSDMQPEEEELEDEFGVALDTPVIITEHNDWSRVSRVQSTYGQLSSEERKAYRTMERYTSPKSQVASVSSRRTEALETVVDEAQSQLDGGAGWQSDATSNGGLLSQFEGDLHLGEGDEGETSLSDGVGAAHSDSQDDARNLMMSASEDDSVVGLETDDDDEGDEAPLSGDEDADDLTALVSGEDSEDADEHAGTAAGDTDDPDTDILDDDEEVVADVFSMDLARFTNDSADIEVAMECLRCARCIGLVISRGDFESILSAAVVLKRTEYLPLLHTWALDQAAEVLAAEHLEGVDGVAVKAFTRDFCERTQQALHDAEHPSEHALAQMATKAQAFEEM